MHFTKIWGELQKISLNWKKWNLSKQSPMKAN